MFIFDLSNLHSGRSSINMRQILVERIPVSYYTLDVAASGNV